jgi:hypothetical protein
MDIQYPPFLQAEILSSARRVIELCPPDQRHAIGFITPADYLAGPAKEIWTERDRKLPRKVNLWATSREIRDCIGVLEHAPLWSAQLVPIQCRVEGAIARQTGLR